MFGPRNIKSNRYGLNLNCVIYEWCNKVPRPVTKLYSLAQPIPLKGQLRRTIGSILTIASAGGPPLNISPWLICTCAVIRIIHNVCRKIDTRLDAFRVLLILKRFPPSLYHSRANISQMNGQWRLIVSCSWWHTWRCIFDSITILQLLSHPPQL